jgi:predicted amidohydrolase YtcJ
MPAADLVIRGTVCTVDERQPTAEALAASDGRIVAVGSRSDIGDGSGQALRRSTSGTAV